MIKYVVAFSYLVPEEQYTSPKHKCHSKDKSADALGDSIADPLADARPCTIAHSPMDSLGAGRAGRRVHGHHENQDEMCNAVLLPLTFVLPGMEWNRNSVCSIPNTRICGSF